MAVESKILSNLSDVERHDLSNDRFIIFDDVLYRKISYTKEELIKERKNLNRKAFWKEAIYYYISWFVASLLSLIKYQSVKESCIFFLILVSLMSIYYWFKHRYKISKCLELMGRRFRTEKVDENALSDEFKELLGKSRERY